MESDDKNTLALFVGLLILVEYVSSDRTSGSSIRTSSSDSTSGSSDRTSRCKVEQEAKYDIFSKRGRRQYPEDDVKKALEANEHVNNFVTSLPDSEPDEYTDVGEQWSTMCPQTYKSLYKYGVTDGDDRCWVAQKLWAVSCKQKKCDHIIKDVVYFRCRLYYTLVSFCAYCETADRAGELRLLRRYLPSDCECRRYFCPGEMQVPPEP